MSRLNLLCLLIFSALLIWISFFQSDQVARIQKGTLTIFSPFIKASGAMAESTTRLEKERLSAAQLAEELKAAERERDQLRLEVLQLDEVLYENNELRSALRYKNRSPLSLVPARVINRKAGTWYNTIIIDKGSEDMIKPDLPVVVPENNSAALIGKVSKVIGPNSSVILLLTDEKCQVPAIIKGTQEQGIVSGERIPTRNQPFFNLRYLSKEAPIQHGDQIITSGIGEVFRKGLVIGEVINSRVGVIDTEAQILPAANFEKLKDVFIVMPNGGSKSSIDLSQEGE